MIPVLAVHYKAAPWFCTMIPVLAVIIAGDLQEAIRVLTVSRLSLKYDCFRGEVKCIVNINLEKLHFRSLK
jgi:hypothetical protein